jgi:hypothetical protein
MFLSTPICKALFSLVVAMLLWTCLVYILHRGVSRWSFGF